MCLDSIQLNSTRFYLDTKIDQLSESVTKLDQMWIEGEKIMNESYQLIKRDIKFPRCNNNIHNAKVSN